MKKTLVGTKIAVLVANGFSEKDMTLTQQALLPVGANIRIVSMDHGLVNSWNDLGWGLNFAADHALNEALAADYDMLIVPGGQRSIDKLKLTAHTRRFINGFTETGKPVALFEEAVDLLVFAGSASGHVVNGPEKCKAEAEAAGAQWSEDEVVISRNIIMGRSSEKGSEMYSGKVCAFFVAEAERTGGDNMSQAA
ncbi:MAG: DJ-1/PfpI family protein [Alphaproteobacteria bacterium]|nr:DJ-1/PfpI family protein [Alphaproteobacteria bacterium]